MALTNAKFISAVDAWTKTRKILCRGVSDAHVFYFQRMAWSMVNCSACGNSWDIHMMLIIPHNDGYIMELPCSNTSCLKITKLRVGVNISEEAADAILLVRKREIGRLCGVTY